MSLQAMVWVIEDAVGLDPNTGDDVDVPAQCIAVLQGLANHADRDGRNAFPSVRLLAHYARKGERAVQKDLRTLEELGLIRHGDQRAAYFIPERYRPTVWDLALERRRAAFTNDRDAARLAGDAGRGGPAFTPPASRGELQDAAGVACGSPEPVPLTGTTSVGISTHVPRAASTASPPARPGGHTPPPPAPSPARRPSPPSGRAAAAWSQLREDLAKRNPRADTRPRRPSGLPADLPAMGGPAGG